MLIDVAIVLITYTGFRLYKHIQKPKAKEEPESEKHQQQYLVKRRQLTKKKRHYYLKMSGVTMGVAVLRNLYPVPPLVLLYLVLYTYVTIPFYKNTENALFKDLLKSRRIDVYLLMGLGQLLTLGISRYFSAALMVTLAYTGDELLANVKEKSESILTENLFSNFLDAKQEVWIVKESVEIKVPLDQIKPGDTIVVKAGEAISVDGIIEKGMASVDQHALTGESYPVEKGEGDSVFASTLLLTGKLYVRVEKSGQATTIAKISQILTQSTQTKTEAQQKGEKWANAGNLPILGLATLSLITIGPMGAIIVLDSNFPQSIRILAPLSTINYVSVASHKNILIKQGHLLETLTEIDTILFDKTGTLTDGTLEVSDIIVCHSSYTKTDILFYAAVAEHQLTHPIGKAILNKAQELGLNLINLEEVKYQQGYGIRIQFDNKVIHVGSGRFMDVEGIFVPQTIKVLQNEIHNRGHSPVMVAIDYQISGIIELQATLRSEVKTLIQNLRDQGVQHIGIISGDHAEPTRKLAELLGADSYFYEQLPEDKAKIVEQFQTQGRKVCFVGDGINDAIAMKQADISISLRGATTLATDVAQIILVDPHLGNLSELMKIARRLESNIWRGLMICLTGGLVMIGSALLLHVDILVAATLISWSFGLGSLGNAMLPLLEIKGEKKALPEMTLEMENKEIALKQ